MTSEIGTGFAPIDLTAMKKSPVLPFIVLVSFCASAKAESAFGVVGTTVDIRTGLLMMVAVIAGIGLVRELIRPEKRSI